ncbi:hypothetical protein V1514DRAFT_298654 [Lipomyces japonicus]|uniref:uncharacterized protein n=1 Tax=Lipomyces japonicus TaxID=56871 RepID=UPI0034CE3DAC
MPPFRDEVVFVISTGSQRTRVQYGLHESLTPPEIIVPTKVYKQDDVYSLESDDETTAIHPIVKGRIVDIKGLLFLMAELYRSTAKVEAGNAPYSPVLFTINSEWKPRQIEEIVSYLLKEVQAPAVTAIPEVLGSAFAYGLPTCLVVNIGKEKTEISPVIDFTIIENVQNVIGVGANEINNSLSKILPTLKHDQIEELKKSPIYEILSDQTQSFFGEPSEPATSTGEEEGIVDIAAIVASDNAREMLAQREQKKKEHQAELKNSDLPRNSFVDSNGRTVEVGKERFSGCEEFIEKLSQGVGGVVSRIDDIAKRGDCWENVVIVGGPVAIKGFHDAFLAALQERFLITRGTTFSELPSGINTPGYATPPSIAPYYGTLGHGQVPTSIRIAKMSEYFIEFKGRTWEDASFLGGQIAAKQIFTPGAASIDGAYLSREDFGTKGIKEFWKLGLL